MRKVDVVRAWKDESYRQNLSAEELASLPANPAGEIELTDSDLGAVYGGATAVVGCSAVCNSAVLCQSGICGSAICNSVAICPP